MSANLEAMILGPLQTFTLSYFAWPPRKAGKNDKNFLTCEKNRISLLIGHTIFFTSEKNRMTNIKERRVLFSEFALGKSQYLYNNKHRATVKKLDLHFIS